LGIASLYFLFEGFYGRKLDWKIIFFTVSGLFVSLFSCSLFAPGFFFYMKDIIFRVFWDTAIAGNKINISEGGELYPNNMIDFMKWNSIILAAMILSVVFEIYQYVDSKKRALIFQKCFRKNRL